MRTKLIALFAAIVIVGTGAVSASPGGGTERGPLKIGVIVSLSGALAEYGTAIKNGIQLAGKEQPSLFTNVNFLYEDDKYDGKHAISAFRKLRTHNGVNVFFSFGSVSAHALAPLAEQYETLLLNFGFEEDPAAGRKFVVRSMNYSSQYMAKLLEYLRARDHKVINIVTTELSFLNSMVEGLRSQLRSNESIVVLDTYNPGEQDFRVTVATIRSQKIKSLGLFLLPDQISQFVRQLREQNLAPILYGTDFFEDASRIAPSPGIMNGAVYADNDPTREFRDRYQTNYGNTNKLTFAANAYDMSVLFAKIARKLKGKKVTSEALVSAVRESPPAESVMGPYSFRLSPARGAYFEYPVVVKKMFEGVGDVTR